MRYIIIFLLFSTGLSAQIDKANITATSDTTFVRPNESKWVFYADTLTRTLPNGTVRKIPIYQADLVTWQDGKRSVTRSTGVLTWKEFATYARGEIDNRNAEIEIIRNGLNQVRAYRDSWIDFLQAQRPKR